MLSEFLKTRNGKTINRALAFMLVITLTFANYMLIGMYFGESSISYAKEEKEVKIELAQNFKTNKVYEFEEGFKRIVQLEVTSKIENAQGSAEIILPETVIENKEAIKTKVNSYDTEFTFENNKLNYETSEVNEFTVTYIYDEEYTYNEDEEKYEFNEEPELNSEELSVEVEIDKNENLSAKAKKIEYTMGIQFGDIITLNEKIGDIFKGNMYLKEDTEYSKKIEVEVSDIEKELLKENIIINSDEKVLQEEIDEETEETIFQEIENSLYYKSSSFSRKELLNIFGNDSEANITIAAKSNEDERNTIILFSEYDEEDEENKEKYNGYEVIDITKISEEDDEIVIEHSEETTEVIIKTTIPEKEGIFNITHNKVIKLAEDVNVEKINKLTSTVDLACEEENGFSVNTKGKYDIKEPETKATLSMEYLNSNQTVLSSLIDNEVNFTVNLLAKGTEHKLYKNPIIKIALPSAVKVASIKDAQLALDDGLKIEKCSINNNTIVIELTGEQTSYNYDEMQQSISVGAVLKVERTTPSGELEIVANCKNGEEEEINLESAKVNVFSPAELISVTNIKVNEQVTTSIEENNTIKIDTFASETVANVDISLINNHGNSIKGLKLEGDLRNEESTFNSALLEAIKLSGIDCEIEYFNGEEKVDDITTAKTYVISIEEMKQGEQLDISYSMSIPENLPYNEKVITSLNMNYEYVGNDYEKELNMQVTTGKGPSAKVEVVPEVESETLNGGQVVTYNIKVTNDGDENIPEAVFTYEAIENGKIIEYNYFQSEDFIYTEDIDNKKEWTIKDLAVDEEVETQIVVKINQVKEKSEFLSKVTLTTGEKTIALEETNTKIVPANFEICMRNITNTEAILTAGEQNRYRIAIKNISGKHMKDVEVKVLVPKNTKFIEAMIHLEDSSKEVNDYNKEEKMVSYKIDEIKKNETIIATLTVEVENIPEELNNELEIKTYAVIGEYKSNIIIDKAYTSDFEIHLNSSSPVTLEKYDDIEYSIEVKNNGKKADFVNIEDSIPEAISVNRITYYTSEDNKEVTYINNSDLELNCLVGVGETLNVEVEGVVKETTTDETSITINNMAKVNLGNGEYVESEVVTNIIKNEKQENLKAENDNSSSNTSKDDNNKDNNNADNTDTYSILGVAWLDENEDGKRESTEKVLEGIEVLLVNATTGEVIENANKEKLTTKTSKDGAYSFEEIKNGDYKILFKYDTSKYQTTEYKKEGINASVNSDATMQTVTINGKTETVALTDTIKIDDSSVVNIDLGLKENDTFDLSLKKQIKKVTVKNSAGTTEYDFKNTDFAKVEIPGKNYKGSTLLIEYEIIIANEGDVTAYVTDILDYMPKDLSFNSEMNTNWYIDSEGNLHDIALSMETLEPGKQVTEKLVLTKTISSDSTLTIKNLAEIASATNTEGLEEKDSTPANKKDGEDDLGQAELIVSIKTGGTWMYIGITLASLIIISAGIFIINKKVLKGNI